MNINQRLQPTSAIVQAPFIEEVSRRVRSTGRGATLRWLADLCIDEASLRAVAIDWIEREFLDCLYDAGHETYPSYYADRLLLPRSTWEAGDKLIWHIIGQIAECLREFESRRVSFDSVDGHDARQHRSRISACRRIIARCMSFIDSELLDAEIERRIEFSMLPCTELHDEKMFIRVIQLFEVTFSYMHEQFRAIAGGGARVVAHLARAAEVLEFYQDFLRLLTTVSIEEFAQIRQATFGRSAVQSTAYRDLENLAHSAAFIAEICAALRESDESSVTELNASLAHLQQGWRAFKRSHWGIARKVIGQNRGTGGTAGVAYLEERARHDLFDLDALVLEGTE